LHIARAKAKLATAKLSLLKSKAKKQRQELKEITLIENLERLKNKAKMLKNFLLFLLEPVKRTANSIILNPKLFANLG
jgi:hypothetical protein